MVWRRVQISDSSTLRELHGVIQVAMGWEGSNLYQFRLRSRCYGSRELWASSPDVTLASLKLRKGARFTYDYDLNLPWRHEVRIEECRLDRVPGKKGDHEEVWGIHAAAICPEAVSLKLSFAKPGYHRRSSHQMLSELL